MQTPSNFNENVTPPPATDALPSPSDTSSRQGARPEIAKPGHNNNFNFIRLVLATLVIVAHSPELLDGVRDREPLRSLFHTLTFGELAVAGFFILSGYFIVQSWDRLPVISDYLKKRTLRIYPGFIVASVVSIFLFGPLGATSVATYFRQINLVSVIKDLLTLNTPHAPLCFPNILLPDYINGSLWTIRYEFICYLMVVALGCASLLKNRRTCVLLFVFLLAFHSAITFATSVHIEGRKLPHVPFVIENLFRFTTYFFAGICFFKYRKEIKFTVVPCIVCGAVLVACMFNAVTAELALPTCGAYLLFAFGWKAIPLLTSFGKRADLSYGVYLYAWPIQKTLIRYYGPLTHGAQLSPWLLSIMALGLSLIFASGSWFLVEQPCLRLKSLALRAGKARATA